MEFEIGDAHQKYYLVMWVNFMTLEYVNSIPWAP